MAEEAVKFGSVSDLAAVYIYKGSAFADDFDALFSLDDTRDLAQHVIGGAHVLKDGAVDRSLQSLARELGLWHHRGDHGFAQHLRIFFQDDRGEGGDSALHLDCLNGILVAYEGHGEGVLTHGGGEFERAVRIGGDACGNGSVFLGYVCGGKCRRLARCVPGAATKDYCILSCCGK